MNYPIPDLSDYYVILDKKDGASCLDTGWYNGQFASDGRPYRARFWVNHDDTAFVSIFFPREGLGQMTWQRYVELLEQEGLVRFKKDLKPVLSTMPMKDPSGNEMCSVHVEMQRGQTRYVESCIPSNPYPKGLLL